MTTRFCADCMSDVGLAPEKSQLALGSCTSNRFVLCEGPRHGKLIIVDPAGRYVPEVLGAPVMTSSFKDVRPGHSLSL